MPANSPDYYVNVDGEAASDFVHLIEADEMMKHNVSKKTYSQAFRGASFYGR